MDRVKELVENGELGQAEKVLDKVLKHAEQSNDKVLLAEALRTKGKVLHMKKRYGQAVVMLEYAAELYREIGDTTHEIHTLDWLAGCYRDLGDDESMNTILMRKQAILAMIHPGFGVSAGQRTRLGSNHSNLSEMSDATIDSAPSTSTPEKKMFSGFMSLFSREANDPTEALLKQIEDGKQFLKQVAAGQAMNANEVYMQKHLMQIHFDSLPFSDIETRVLNTAMSCADAVEEKATRFYRALREFVYLAKSSKKEHEKSEFIHLESPGSLRHALCEWEAMNIEFGNAAAAKSQDIKDKVLLPFAKMKDVYKTICEYYINQTRALERRVENAKKVLDQERAALQKARTKRDDIRAKLNPDSPMKKSLSESMNDFLGKNKETPSQRLASAQSKAASDIAVQEAAVKNAKERVDALKGALSATRKRSCQELELIEQSRMEVTVELLRVLVAIQQELLDLWHKYTLNMLKRLTFVEPASDIRTYCNRSLIHSVLLGKTSPCALFGTPLDKLRELQEEQRLQEETLVEDEEDHGLATEDEGEMTQEEEEEEEQHCEEDDEVVEFDIKNNDEQKQPSYIQDIDQFMHILLVRNDGEQDEEEGGENQQQQRYTLVKNICEDFQNRAAREYFLLCLNRFRSSKTRVAKSVMDDLILAMIAFLDAVYIQGDVKAAKMALILSETFYTTDEEDEDKTPTNDNDEEQDCNLQRRKNRFYVQDGIKEHGIWKSNHFWEETFYLALREEIHRNVVKTVRDGTSSRRRSLSQANYKNIAYAQIGSSAFNMISVGLPHAQVRNFVQRMCEGNDITKQEHDTLIANLL